MSLVTVLWSMGAGAALTLAVLYGSAWWVDRRTLGNLMFCITALAVVAIARTEVGMLHASSIAGYGDWARKSSWDGHIRHLPWRSRQSVLPVS